jgi:single-stranded DNA-binding protein
MAEKYVTVGGFVQFDPQERDVNGKQVTDVVVKSQGGDGKFIRVTIWPESPVEEVLGRKVKKGDLLHTDGKFSSSMYQDKQGQKKTSLQISAFLLNINGKPIERPEREVVRSEDTESSDSDVF